MHIHNFPARASQRIYHFPQGRVVTAMLPDDRDVSDANHWRIVSGGVEKKTTMVSASAPMTYGKLTSGGRPVFWQMNPAASATEGSHNNDLYEPGDWCYGERATIISPNVPGLQFDPANESYLFWSLNTYLPSITQFSCGSLWDVIQTTPGQMYAFQADGTPNLQFSFSTANNAKQDVFVNGVLSNFDVVCIGALWDHVAEEYKGFYNINGGAMIDAPVISAPNPSQVNGFLGWRFQYSGYGQVFLALDDPPTNYKEVVRDMCADWYDRNDKHLQGVFDFTFS